MTGNLQQTQRQFCHWLRNPSTPVPNGLAAERMAIYHEVVLENIKTFVEVTYPISQKMLKKREWQQLLHSFMAHHFASSPFFYDIANELRLYLQTATAQAQLPWLGNYPCLSELLHYEYLEVVVHRQSPLWTKPNRKGVTLTTALQTPTQYQLQLNTQLWLMVYQYPVYRLTAQQSKAHMRATPHAPSAIIVFKNSQQYLTWQYVDPVQAVILEWLLTKVSDKPRTLSKLRKQLLKLTLPLDNDTLQSAWLPLLQLLDSHNLLAISRNKHNTTKA